jgi:hypothetical protein
MSRQRKQLPLLLLLCLLLSTFAVERDSRAEEPCTKAGWCTVFELPRGPSGQWLGKVWGTGPNDIFAVGRYTTAHYDGTSWRLVDNHSKSGIADIGGSGPSDVYAVGSYQTIQRWDGTKWTLEHFNRASGLRRGMLTEVVVTAPGEAYALSLGQKAFERIDGKWVADKAEPAWTDERPQAPSGLKALCNGAANTAKASPKMWFARCDRNRRAYLHDGVSWISLGKTPAPKEYLRDAFATGPDDVLAAFDDGRMYRYNGSRWLREDQGIREVVGGFWSDGTWLYATARDSILRKRLTKN